MIGDLARPDAGVPPGAVVVALDGGPADPPALRWGEEQARASGRPLHVARVAVDRRLQVLVGLSRRAHLLVLGGGCSGDRGHHAFLAMRARCPVVVVPWPAATPQDRGRTVPTARRRAVVVGVDGAHAARGALDLAFAHAARSGCELRVVHVWPPRTPGGPDHDAGWDERRRTVAEVLSGYRERHPEATVLTHLVRGDVVDALVGRSWNAELLVLSGCDGARRPGLMPGAVTLGVLERATCPVALVRDGAMGARASAVREPVGAQR